MIYYSLIQNLIFGRKTLLRMMNNLDATSDFDKICSQPRWYFEELYNRF